MSLPDLPLGLVIRTDFSDQAAWENVVARVTLGYGEQHGGPGGGGEALLHFVDDVEFAGLTAERARELAVGSDFRAVVFLADGVTMGSPYRMVLVVAGPEEEGDWWFRSAPESVARVEMMLCTGKHSFRDYLDDVEDGVYPY